MLDQFATRLHEQILAQICFEYHLQGQEML